MSILDGVNLPYKPGESPSQPAASTPTVATPAADTASAPTGILKDVTLPYKPGELPAGQTVAPTAPPPTAGQTASKWTDWLLGQDQGPVELHPRSLGQAGSDVENFGRAWGNKAFIPGALDVGLAALHGDDVSAENAKTTQARTDIGPVASGIADFMGQRLSLNRMAGEGGVPWANTPIAQGIVTGGGGTLLHGGDWKDALVNAAADTGLSSLGEAAGTAGAAVAKKVIDQSKQAVSSVASAGLEHLGDLWKRGGDVAGTAEQYAASAKGAAQDAYQRIAEAANQSTDTRWAQRLAAAGIGHLPGIPGGELAAAYIADPAIRAYNQWSKGQGVRNAIDQAYPAVANAVKTAVNPDSWRSALQNLAVSQGPTNAGSTQAVAKFGPMSWVRGLFPGGN